MTDTTSVAYEDMNFDQMSFGGIKSRGGSSVASSRAGSKEKGTSQYANIRLTEEEYEMIARDIMAKPPFSGSLKYRLPLKYAARTDEVKWQWVDEVSGRMVYRELIGGGKNSDLDF